MRLFIVALASQLIALPAAAGTIGLFADGDCSSCGLTIPPGGAGTFTIAYVPSAGEPVRAAQFRVTGLPAGWIVTSITPNPAASLVLGNPLAEGAILTCPSSLNGACVTLFTVQLEATTQVTDGHMEVTQHTTPTQPALQCPAVYACDSCDSWACATGGRLALNPTQPCVVGVAPSAWSRAKQLFR